MLPSRHRYIRSVDTYGVRLGKDESSGLRCSPFLDPTLKRSDLSVRKFSRLFGLESLKDLLGRSIGFGL